MVQSNPQILQVTMDMYLSVHTCFNLLILSDILMFVSFICWQPMLQELGKQNPHLMRLIQEHQADFLQLINEPMEGGEYVLFNNFPY